jgi:hypothetical protein
MRLAAAFAAALLFTGATAGTAAAADTSYETGPLGYACTFPAMGTQPVTLVARFTGPGTVAPGAAFTAEDLSGGLTVSTQVYTALVTTLGVFAVRGGGTLPVTAVNAVPVAAGGVVIPEAPMTMSIGFSGGSATFTAGEPGVAVAGMGTPFSLSIEFHLRSGNRWLPWTMHCGLRPTRPAQDPSFRPELLIE